MENRILSEQQIPNSIQENHLCLIYNRDPLEQMPALIPFIKQGLENNERFIYIADDISVEQLSLILKISGIDVETESNRGSLKLWTRKEWRQPGELDSQKKSEQVQGLIDDALKAGFKGIRFAVEMTWTLGPDISAEKLEHWEATINTIFTPGFPGKIICQYSRHKLSAPVINQALKTHPFAIVNDCVCHNTFYEDPLILKDKSETSRSEWMISQLVKNFGTDRRNIMEEQTKKEVESLADSTSLNKNSLSPAADVIQVLGKKYSMPILSFLVNKVSTRFSDIKCELGGISSSTLSQRLVELKDAGLVKREIYAEVPSRVEYSLSKEGAKLLRTLKSILKSESPGH